MLGFTVLAAGASFVFTAEKQINFQHMFAATVMLVGLSVITVDWWVSRGIKRSGGVQAMRSGGVLSTGPGATAGRLWAQGEGFRISGLHDDARKNFNEAANLFKEAKDPAGEILVKLSQGDLATEVNDPQSADRFYHEAEEAAKETKDVRGEGRALVGLGTMNLRQRGYEAARQQFEDARRAFSSDTDRFGEASALLGLGEACVHVHKMEEGGSHLDQARFLFSQVGDRIDEIAGAPI